MDVSTSGGLEDRHAVTNIFEREIASYIQKVSDTILISFNASVSVARAGHTAPGEAYPP